MSLIMDSKNWRGRPQLHGVQAYGRTTYVRGARVGAWCWDSERNGTLKKLENEVYDASLAASDAFQARKKELESSGRYTTAGIREELKKFHAALVAPVLEKAKAELQAANEALAARRSSIKPGTAEPKFSEVQKAEARAILRTMPHKQAVSILAGSDADPLFVEAVLEAKAHMVAISPALRAELERGALQKRHGPEIEELTEIESALTTAARAAQVAADDIALELREDTPQRPQLVRTA